DATKLVVTTRPGLLHVAPLALREALLPLVEGRGGGAGAAIEGALLPRQKFRPAAPRLHARERLVGEVVVVEVFVRDHPDRAQPVRAEEAALPESEHATLVGP